MLSIIIPTYNEKENISFLVKNLHRIFKRNYELIIVDDNSPDKTGELAEKLSERYPIYTIHRNERGLATAVIEGFKHARGDVLCVMDADLQHSPEIVLALTRKLENGADIAIGSRYIKNGGIESWSLKRKIISICAKILAHLLLPRIRTIKDPLSGVFALKKKVINNVLFQPIGYKILLEILIKGNYNRVVEVPYIFKCRERGKSNLRLKEYIDYLKHLYQLEKIDREAERFLKFCLVGFFGVFVNMGLLWILTEFIGLFYLISAVFSIQTAIFFNFTLNEIWTFKDRRLKASVLKRALRFNLISFGGLIVNFVILYALTAYLGIFYLISNLFGIAGAVLWNFKANTIWTWRK